MRWCVHTCLLMALLPQRHTQATCTMLATAHLAIRPPFMHHHTCPPPPTRYVDSEAGLGASEAEGGHPVRLASTVPELHAVRIQAVPAAVLPVDNHHLGQRGAATRAGVQHTQPGAHVHIAIGILGVADGAGAAVVAVPSPCPREHGALRDGHSGTVQPGPVGVVELYFCQVDGVPAGGGLGADDQGALRHCGQQGGCVMSD
jgi:hypothetical protein